MFLAHPDLRVLVLPSGQGLSQLGPGGGLVGEFAGLIRSRRAGQPAGQLQVLIAERRRHRVPAQRVHGHEQRTAHRRFLEREAEAVRGFRRVTDPDDDLTVHGHAVLVRDHDRARRVLGDVPAHRAEDHRAEAAGPAGPDDEHGRPGGGCGEGLGGRPGHQVGVDEQARRDLPGPGEGRREGPCRDLVQDVGDGGGHRVLRPHPGRHHRHRDDAQRGLTPHGLACRPFHGAR